MTWPNLTAGAKELRAPIPRVAVVYPGALSVNRWCRVSTDWAKAVAPAAPPVGLAPSVAGAATPSTVRAVPRVAQALANLVDNAIKYTPSGGHIALNSRTSNGEAILEVADDGPGIPPESLPHIFERFFRADSVRTHGVNGAGLGLSIVRSICLAHGGSVHAANRPEGGCRITVHLPVAPTK